MPGLLAIGHLIDCQTPQGGRGTIHRKRTCRTTNQLWIYPANFTGTLGRPILHPLCKVVESIAPLVNEFLVVQILGNNDMSQAKAEGRIGTGAKLEMVFSMRGDPCNARINDDQL